MRELLFFKGQILFRQHRSTRHLFAVDINRFDAAVIAAKNELLEALQCTLWFQTQQINRAIHSSQVHLCRKVTIQRREIQKLATRLATGVSFL